MPMMGAGP
jgi:polyadenylate-binding protein